MTDRPRAFVAAVLVIVASIVTGPCFGYGATWPLAMNTGPTTFTLLVVLLIQTTQNRDEEVVQIKRDELRWATHGAHDALLDLEELEDSELQQVRAGSTRLAALAGDQPMIRPYGHGQPGRVVTSSRTSDDAAATAALGDLPR